MLKTCLNISTKFILTMMIAGLLSVGFQSFVIAQNKGGKLKSPEVQNFYCPEVPTTVIYYVNGAGGSKDSTISSLGTIRKEYENFTSDKLPCNEQHKLEFRINYNPEGEIVGGISKLLYQKKDEIKYDKKFYELSERQMEFYLNDLKAGKRVLIIAHSQGTIYSNQVFKRIIAIPEYRNSIGLINLATFAHEDFSKAHPFYSYYTIEEDLVVKGIKNSLSLLIRVNNSLSDFLNFIPGLSNSKYFSDLNQRLEESNDEYKQIRSNILESNLKNSWPKEETRDYVCTLSNLFQFLASQLGFDDSINKEECLENFKISILDVFDISEHTFKWAYFNPQLPSYEQINVQIKSFLNEAEFPRVS